MKLTFIGDLVYPTKDCINIDKIKDIFKNSITIANLEGQIISDEFKIVDEHKYNLYSDQSVVDILNIASVKYLSFANNHIQDFRNEIGKTIDLLNNSGIEHFGTKDKPSINIDNQIKIYGVVANVTGGIFNKKEIVNRFNPQELLKLIKADRKKNPALKIVIYVHWGYELAKYPQPADREWAHLAIDCGANYIIGHHPHVVQGAEKYNNGYMFYSVGNFLMPQVEYLGRILTYFDDRVQIQLSIEINFSDNDNDEFFFHILNYNKTDSSIHLLKSVNSIEDAFFKNLTPFKGLNATAYKKWFKRKNYSRKLFNTNPTYNSYLFLNGINKTIKDNYLLLIWKIRKLLIKNKIHKPYNW
jgi:Bacterial capsule synthesis protein PGA_cap